MQRINGPGLDHTYEVSRSCAYRRFRKLFLGNTCEEAAFLAEPAPLGRRGFAEITRLKLGGGAIRTEVQDPFSRQIVIAGAVLPNLLAGSIKGDVKRNHGVTIAEHLQTLSLIQ
jgi:hypothetical protein